MNCCSYQHERAPSQRPRLEVADIFRKHGHQLGTLSREQDKVVRNITNCRTASLGGHLMKCDHCDHEVLAYDSCCDRHCPKCQALAKVRWLDNRKADLLPVPYFHLVFTVPHVLNPVALQNKRTFYSVLFRAASETLKEVAANPKHLGAEIGFIAVLHTWGQKLVDHPHIHCLVPGGGLAPEGDRWIPSRSSTFLLPVQVLSAVFRGKFLDYLEQAYQQDRLSFHGKIGRLADPGEFKRLLVSTTGTGWNVYCRPPFDGPERVLDYLGRYVHRIAISNNRLVSLENGEVAFKYRDYADKRKVKTMSLKAIDFMRRFLLHVLPKGFVRVRYYGLLGSRNHGTKLLTCKRLLGVVISVEELERKASETWEELMIRVTGVDVSLCPICHKGHLRKCRRLLPQHTDKPDGIDSS